MPVTKGIGSKGGSMKEEPCNDNDEAGFPAHAKAEIARKLEALAVPRLKVEYTEENFKRLFGEWNRVETPIGRVTVPRSQFIKLKDRNREGWLGAVYQTITDPILIVRETIDKNLYVKTFAPEKKGVIVFLSVVIEQGSSRVNISNHEKGIKNILNKIKKADDLAYQKASDTGFDSLTALKTMRGVLPAGGNYGGSPPSH